MKNIQHAIAIDPNRAAFHSALAMLEARTPDGEGGAEQELQQGGIARSEEPRLHISAGGLLEKKGDHQGAEQQFMAAVSGCAEESAGA